MLTALRLGVPKVCLEQILDGPLADEMLQDRPEDPLRSSKLDSRRCMHLLKAEASVRER